MAESREREAIRAEVVKWLKGGRCPECGFTFAACTCGDFVRELLELASESVSVQDNDLLWQAATAAERERCAKIADAQKRYAIGNGQIADDIRKGSNE